MIHLLLVEDDAADVLIVRQALAGEGGDNLLHVVADGALALDFLRRQGQFVHAPTPDLILLDLHLPRLGGRQVLAEVKADPDLRQIPVVVLTVSQAEEDVLRSYELHANAFVTKPADAEVFIQVLREISGFFLDVVRLPSR